MSEFQPTLLGTEVRFECPVKTFDGMVTDETEHLVYIESDFFTGWFSKAAFIRMCKTGKFA